jgi:chromosome segregation ATPase
MAARPGQLDQISEAIGKLKGSSEAVEKYVHEQAHGVNNLSQKLDAMAVEQAKRHDSLKLELSAQMDKIAATLRAEIAQAVSRIATLEQRNSRDDGARSVKQWIIDHSPIATLIALLAAVAAWIKH